MRTNHILQIGTIAALLLASPLSAFAESDSANQRSPAEARARMGNTETVLHGDLQKDVRTLVHEMVASAVNGDLEDYVDYLSDEDRTRIEKITAAHDVRGLSASFVSRWSSDNGRSFESGLNAQQLPITVKDVTENTARVVVGSPKDNVELRLVKGGWFDMAWRIDAPDSVTLTSLETKVNEAIGKIEAAGAASGEAPALLNATVALLRPVATQS